MKAKQKIEKWLDECGYVEDKSCVTYVNTKGGVTAHFIFHEELKRSIPKIICLVNPDGKVHIPPADLHEDDKPEPEQREDIARDKALQEFFNSAAYEGKYFEMMQEFNSRVKALESILLDGGKGE